MFAFIYNELFLHSFRIKEIFFGEYILIFHHKDPICKDLNYLYKKKKNKKKN
jgi:hypothetical protein